MPRDEMNFSLACNNYSVIGDKWTIMAQTYFWSFVASDQRSEVCFGHIFMKVDCLHVCVAV